MKGEHVILSDSVGLRCNDCWRCPLLDCRYGAEEVTSIAGILFSQWIANKLVEHEMLCRVDDGSLRKWLSSSYATVDESHIDHLPPYLPPGIAAVLPDDIARTSGSRIVLIDGNHRGGSRTARRYAIRGLRTASGVDERADSAHRGASEGMKTPPNNPYAGLRYIPLSGRYAIEKAAHHADFATLEEAQAARDALNHNPNLKKDETQ